MSQITDRQLSYIGSLAHNGFYSADVYEALNAIRGDVEIPEDIKFESDCVRLDKTQASALIDELKRQLHKA